MSSPKPDETLLLWLAREVAEGKLVITGAGALDYGVAGVGFDHATWYGGAYTRWCEWRSALLSGDPKAIDEASQLCDFAISVFMDEQQKLEDEAKRLPSNYYSNDQPPDFVRPRRR